MTTDSDPQRPGTESFSMRVLAIRVEKRDANGKLFEILEKRGDEPVRNITESANAGHE